LTCEFAEKHPDKSSFLYVPIHWSKRRLPEWYDIKKRDYNGDEAQIAQELDMSREGSVQGRVFKQFVQAEHTCDIKVGEFKPVVSVNGFDFGWVHDTICLIISPYLNGWVVLDEHVKNETPVQLHAKECWKKVRDWQIERPIWVSDPSGEARSREVGKSFWQLYNPTDKELLSQPEFMPQDRIVFEGGDKVSREGIAVINTMFYKGELKVNKRCTHLIDALNEAVYPVNKNGQPTDEVYKDDWYADPCDALIYAGSRLAKYKGYHTVRQQKLTYGPRVNMGLGLGNYGGRK
jgi:hypothetical protein